MGERRKLERFELCSPARVLLESGGNKKNEQNLVTRDVSSAGAFLYSSQPLPEGTSVRMEFVLSFDALRKLAGEDGRAKVRVKGKVIRSDSDGIAIRFDSGYKITTLNNNSSHNGLR
jgi:PilZ domain